MKKLILSLTFVGIVALLLTACSNRPAAEVKTVFVDTSGLAQFQAWKAMNEMEATAPVAYRSASAKTAVRKTSSGNSGTMSSSTTNEAKVSKKKGWSKAAKYGVIGGGTGVVLGAVINKKNRVAGGAIGGAVLGGLGYVLGRAQDKKDGRF